MIEPTDKEVIESLQSVIRVLGAENEWLKKLLDDKTLVTDCGECERLRNDNNKLAIEAVTAAAALMFAGKSNGCSTKELIETAQLTKKQP